MYKKLPVLTLVCIALLAANLPLVYGGVIVLNSGQEIEGQITKKTDQYLEVQVNGDNLHIDLNDVKALKGRKPRFSQENNLNSLNHNLTFVDALQLASEGSFLRAEEAFKALLEKNPSDTNITEALNAIEDVRNGSIKEKFARLIFEGAYYSVKEDYRKSIESFTKALKIEPESMEVYYSLASSHQALDEHEKSIPYFEKLLEHDPEDADVLFNLGAANYFLGKYDAAITYLRRLDKIIPYIPEAYSLLGVSYYNLGDQAKGKEYIDQARELFLEKNDLFAVSELEELLKEFTQTTP